jgi:2',3'-cyclic-nucleotide 2'-phosphodiesterase (5'-nucleotidase family)
VPSSNASWKQAIAEAGYRGGPESQGYFPQISGFRVCVDRSRPEFDRIVSLQVPTDEGWTDIENDREYTLVVPDFLYRGGDGYEIPKNRFASRPGSELKYLVLDAVLRAQGLGEAVGEPVTDPAGRCEQLLVRYLRAVVQVACRFCELRVEGNQLLGLVIVSKR